MNQRPKRVINRNLAATSTVRLIEAFIPPEPEQSTRIILKPKVVNKNIPGTKLLRKLAEQRENEKMKRVTQRELARAVEPVIDEAAVEDAITDIFRALEI